MGSTISLTSSDGFQLSAYHAEAEGRPRGGVVVVQEIFGVNDHIRSVVDRYAAAGYLAIAPAIFDRERPGIELGYTEDDIAAGRDIARVKLDFQTILADVAAAGNVAAEAGKVGVVGYCLGGSLAWLAATRLPGFAAAVGYYGGLIAAHLDETPRCPVMLHFGEEDRGISMDDVARIKAEADPALVQVFTYPGAGHAFNREASTAWHEPSAKLARERTLAFLREHVG